jgi:peptidoglycan/LPS O-acetylase OafA/YrhL
MLKPMNKKNESVQMMRGIAALSVVFCHLGMIGVGGFGVDLFFCISGFIMMFVTEKSCDGFLKKRFLRICPLYYLLTIGAFAMAFIAPNLLRDANMELAALLRSFLFIGSTGNNNIIVGVGWTLCYEMFFYLLFFISFKISHKNRHIISITFLTIIVLAGLVIKPSNEYLLFYTQPILLEFALGIWAYKILYRRAQYNTIQYNTIHTRYS